MIAFNVEGLPHGLTAAIIGTEGAIGVRNGCFCAHPYVKELLHVSPEDDRILAAEVVSGNKSRMPGLVRASLGCYNNEADIDTLAEMLERTGIHCYQRRMDYRTGIHERARECIATIFDRIWKSFR